MSATVREIESPLAALPQHVETDVLILPREVDNETGLYDDSALTLAKDLREEGISADYQHPPEARDWIGERGADILIAFIVGIASNAAWSALAGLLRRRHSQDQVRVRAARIRDRDAKVDWEWFEVEGAGEDVATAVEALGDDGGEAERD